MSVWPKDPDDRFNVLVIGSVVLFGVWIGLILIGQIFGHNQDVKDDALLIGAAATLISVLLGNYRHGQKIDRIEEKMNGKE